MKRSIYVVCDQVSGYYGSVVDFANHAECIRSFKLMYESGTVPKHYVRDAVIIHIADMDTESGSPVVTPVLPVIIFYGSEVLANEETSD